MCEPVSLLLPCCSEFVNKRDHFLLTRTMNAMCHSSCLHASPLSLGTPAAVEVDVVVFDAAGVEVDDCFLDASSTPFPPPATSTHASSPLCAAAAAAASAAWRAAMRLVSSSVESHRAATSSSSSPSPPIESRSIVFFVLCVRFFPPPFFPFFLFPLLSRG